MCGILLFFSLQSLKFLLLLLLFFLTLTFFYTCNFISFLRAVDVQDKLFYDMIMKFTIIIINLHDIQKTCDKRAECRDESR